MFDVILSHEAIKNYRRYDTSAKRKINKCIDQLRDNPLFGRHIARLYGEFEGSYRYSLGNLRIIYEVDLESKLVRIESIKSRGSAYK